MNKAIIGACFAAPMVMAPLIVAAPGASLPAAGLQRLGYSLTSEALVMIPSMNQDWLDLSKSLYLVPNGFPEDSVPTFLQVPETGDLNASLAGAQAILIDAIETRWTDGNFSADDPLYVFGYSQNAVAAGLTEQHLSEFGIPQDALHFVMVGDSASSQGGFLSGFVDTLLKFFPESWRPDVTQLIEQFAQAAHIDSSIGLITPDNLYPTDVYTLTGDGFANWDDGANLGGLFWDHLAYLGLTPDEINTAGEPFKDGLTNYFTIDSGNVDMLTALMNSFDMVASPFV
ncbi:MAG: PE-PPE domain-containing protein [Mycobacterium sp.]